MRSFLREIKERVLVFDGSKGTMLQRYGLTGGECPELWNTTHSDVVRKIYELYKQAGSDVIQTNTFQGNRIKLKEYSLEDRTYELNFEGARLAREVMGKDGFVAASIGPVGMLFEPLGDLTFELAYATYKEQVKAVTDGGVDIINFETFTDLGEMRAALLAAKDVCSLPVICSVAFEANGRTLSGSTPYITAVVLSSLGADMIGTNCSFGPEHMLGIVKGMAEAGGAYLSVKPNAGLPELIDGNAVYKESPEKFAELAVDFIRYNARLLGGCCGTTPEFISAIKTGIGNVDVPKVQNKCERIITSDVKMVNLDDDKEIQIGRLDTSLDNELLKDLSNGIVDSVIDVSSDLFADGCDAIYINVDNADKDGDLLSAVVKTAQPYAKVPFILETQEPEALDKALRIYKGKAGIAISNGNNDKIEEILAVAKKYGSTIVDKTVIMR